MNIGNFLLDAAAKTSGNAMSSTLFTVVYLVVIVGVMYFLLIRPINKNIFGET